MDSGNSVDIHSMRYESIGQGEACQPGDPGVRNLSSSSIRLSSFNISQKPAPVGALWDTPARLVRNGGERKTSGAAGSGLDFEGVWRASGRGYRDAGAAVLGLTGCGASDHRTMGSPHGAQRTLHR